MQRLLHFWKIMHRIIPHSWFGNYPRLLWLVTVVFSLVMVLPISDLWADEKKSAGEEAREFRELVYQLRHRIEVLEQQKAEQDDAKQDTKAEAPESTHPTPIASKSKKVPLPVDKVLLVPSDDKIQLSFGGQIVAEAVSNWPGNKQGSDFDPLPADVPTGSGGENGQFNLSAKETRLWLKTSSMTKLGLFKALLEFDFKGGNGVERFNNSHNPRMRHGYAQLGNLAVGQTESTFSNPLTWPDTIPDPIAYLSNRQAMVRWTQMLDEDFELQIALENPETTLTDAAGDRILPADDRVPDLTMKSLWYTDRGFLALSGLLREIRSDGAVVGGVEDSKVGGGLHFSGKLRTTGIDNVRFNLAAGNAIGRYASSNSFNDGSIDANGLIELHMMYLTSLSYQHWMNDHWRISATGSHIQVDNDLNRVPDTIVEHSQSYHLRLSWLPLLSTIFSVEYTHARSKLESGLEGEQNRLHFRARYKF